MKNLVDLMNRTTNIVDILWRMAYTSAYSYDQKIARTAMELYEEIKMTKRDVYQILFSVKGVKKEQLLNITDVIEHFADMADSATDISRMITEGKEMHPVLKNIIKSDDRIAFIAEITQSSPFAGSNLMEINLKRKTGVEVNAIKRGKKWIISPKREERLRANDTIVCSGKQKNEDIFKKAILGKLKI